LALRYAVRSDRGLVRSNNEDSVYAGPRLLAIADGMGGHAAGEVASKIVIGMVEHLDEDRPVADLIGTLRDTVTDASTALANAVDEDSELEGMGTTLTAIRFSGSRIALVHVGDSRAYLMRGGQLSQITHDDTYVQSLVDSGKLTAEEASHHPRKSVILRALTGADIDPDISIREARKGDRYLLCSDGLSDVVTSATLLEALSTGTPQDCADQLIELALRGGGPDNVTCIVADVVEEAGVDDMPVIGGAVMDPAEAPKASANSPAARAANMTRRHEPAAVLVSTKNGRRRRIALVCLVILAVLGLGTTGYFWTQSQYFVGQAGGEVAVFRGVNAQFGPVSLSSVLRSTDLRVADLTQSARSQVKNGITARDRGDADQIVTRLTGELIPICQPPTPTPTPTPKPTPRPTARATTKTTAHASASKTTPKVTPTTSVVPPLTSSVPPPECRKSP
jgi:protein phosphatase